MVSLCCVVAIEVVYPYCLDRIIINKMYPWLVKKGNNIPDIIPGATATGNSLLFHRLDVLEAAWIVPARKSNAGLLIHGVTGAGSKAESQASERCRYPEDAALLAALRPFPNASRVKLNLSASGRRTSVTWLLTSDTELSNRCHYFSNKTCQDCERTCVVQFCGWQWQTRSLGVHLT